MAIKQNPFEKRVTAITTALEDTNAPKVRPPYHRGHKTAGCKVTLAQYARLRGEANRRGVSVAALILSIIEDFLADL